MRSLKSTVVAATLLLGLLPAAARAQARPAASESDAAAATEIERRFTVDRGINAQNVTIYVRDGVATLSGRVPEEDAKRRAERLAADVPGVERVHNRISVRSGVRLNEEAPPIPDRMPGHD